MFLKCWFFFNHITIRYDSVQGPAIDMRQYSCPFNMATEALFSASALIHFNIGINWDGLVVFTSKIFADLFLIYFLQYFSCTCLVLKLFECLGKSCAWSQKVTQMCQENFKIKAHLKNDDMDWCFLFVLVRLKYQSRSSMGHYFSMLVLLQHSKSS